MKTLAQILIMLIVKTELNCVFLVYKFVRKSTNKLRFHGQNEFLTYLSIM